MPHRSYILFLILIFMKVSVANQLANPFIPLEYTSKLKIGDWIFRKGTQTDSLIVRHISKGDYSHIGMIIAVVPEIKIIHATTNDDPNHPNQVIISNLSQFITPELAEKFAIARPNFLTIPQQQKIVDYLLTKQGATFILAPQQNEHLYCTTLLLDAISQYQTDFKLVWEYVNFPFMSGYYLFPTAFANHNDIQWIYRYPTQ